MKKFLTILAALLTIIAGVIFAGNKVTLKKEDSLRIMVISNAPDIDSATIAFIPLKENLSYDNQWISFKRVSEMKFNDIEILINGLKAKMETRGATADVNYVKRILYLEEQVRFEQARLEAFEKNPVNWEFFKPGFLYEINAIIKKAKELGTPGEAAVAENRIKVSD